MPERFISEAKQETDVRRLSSTTARTVGLYFLALVIIGTGTIPTTAALVHFQNTGQMPEGMEDTARYLDHLAVLIAHVVSGTGFVLLGPLQFIAGLRGRRPMLHRVLGRLFVVAGVVMGLSGLALLIILPGFGPAALAAGTAAIGGITVFAIAVAFAAILQGQVAQHRAWMIRGYAVGMSVATQRLTILPLFAAFGMPDLNLIAALVWFSLIFNLGVAEWILRRPAQVVVAV